MLQANGYVVPQKLKRLMLKTFATNDAD